MTSQADYLTITPLRKNISQKLKKKKGGEAGSQITAVSCERETKAFKKKKNITDYVSVLFVLSFLKGANVVDPD